MNAETNISPAPVRRLGGLSNLLASTGAGGNWRFDMSTDPYYSDGVLIDPSGGELEAVAQAAETIRTVQRYSGTHIADPTGPLVRHLDYLVLEEAAEQMRDQRDELADALEALLRAIYQTPAPERLAAHVNARHLAEAALRKAGRS